MALKSTIFKVDLDISDMERNYYQSHALTLARHASETDERMMVRLLAFARHAHEFLCFTDGLANTEEPDLWQKDLTGLIDLWVEVGQPDERRLLKACGRATQVIVYCYSSSAPKWWRQLESRVERAKNLAIYYLPDTGPLSALAQRTMKLHCTLQEGTMWWTAGDETVAVDLETLR